MANKNATYKVDNGDGTFDDLMFKTNANQVFYDDGNSLKDKFDIKDGLLWRGYHHMSEKETVTPSKSLSKCQHGWVIIWSDWDDGSEGQDWNICYSYIPKNTIFKTGQNTTLPLTSGEAGWAIKTLYIYDNYFKGNTTNKDGSNYDVVIRAVIEY